MVALTPELVLRAYAVGIFPMAEDSRSDQLYWFDPEMRGILPLDTFHVPRRLRRTVRQAPFEIRTDSDFAATIRACGGGSRSSTWINHDIERVFTALHHQGHAHSVEAWQGGTLVGGLYGVAVGAAFFGESMFSLVTDASKVALVHLVARLRAGGFVLCDTQFMTAHLGQFGGTEIPRDAYRRRLAAAVQRGADWSAGGAAEAFLVASLLHETSQRS